MCDVTLAMALVHTWVLPAWPLICTQQKKNHCTSWPSWARLQLWLADLLCLHPPQEEWLLQTSAAWLSSWVCTLYKKNHCLAALAHCRPHFSFGWLTSFVCTHHKKNHCPAWPTGPDFSLGCLTSFVCTHHKKNFLFPCMAFWPATCLPFWWHPPENPLK